MRIARIGLVGALLLGASACQTDDGGPVTRTLPPLAFVRYINAVPDTNNLTVRFIDQVENVPQSFFNVPFRGLGQGGYQGVEAGAQRLRVFRHDPNLSTTTGGLGASTEQLADTTFTFVAGQYYTMLHLGFARTGQTPAQRVILINDALPATNTSVSVRAIHAGLGIGNVDIFATPLPTTTLVGATPAFTNVAFQAVSAYATLPVGQFAAQVALAGTTASAAAAAAPAGIAGTPAADPVAGATVGGSVLTAIAFPASVAGSPAAASAAPSVVWFSDRQPPRTTSP